MAVAPFPPTHLFCGSNKARQEVGDPGHCEGCARYGHVAFHPTLGCGDVGCSSDHGDGHPADEAGIRALAAGKRERRAVRKPARA
jgi:hypothetical protein